MKKLTIPLALALVFLPALNASQHDSNSPVFYAQLSPSNEVPPVVGAPHMGDATIQLHLTRDTSGNITQAIADFQINYIFGSAEMITGIHIHEGVAGQNGGHWIEPPSGPPTAVNGSGTIFRNVVLTDPVSLDRVKAVIANPSGYYVNVHTETNTGGAIRGQLTQNPVLEGIEELGMKVDAMAQDLAKLDAMKTQLDGIQGMLRDIGRVLGLTFAR